MCYAEYRGFFHIGMITRNERNAIIQHGTMTMVRRTQLRRPVPGPSGASPRMPSWACASSRPASTPSTCPRATAAGLMPDTFIDFKKQRFRWAYGAMQILKSHARALFIEGGPLSPGQRYHFIAGWLPWVADGCNMLFNVAALAWSAAMVCVPRQIDPPLVMYSVLPLSLFTFKLAKLAHLYQVRVGANFRQTLAAAVAGLALTHTIGMAVVKGLLTRGEPFFRTPKNAGSRRLFQALAASRDETLIMFGLWLSAWGVSHSTTDQTRGPDRIAWVVVLLIQSIPYLSSLVVSLTSAFPLPAKLLGRGYRSAAFHPPQPQRAVEPDSLAWGAAPHGRPEPPGR